MVYFTGIRKTQHYIDQHEKQVSMLEVTKVIFSSQKQIRKIGNKLVINNDSYYILFEVKNNMVYVINAKRK